MKLKVKRLKKWLNKALLCGALACALALPAGFAVSAEEGELPPNAEPGAQITAAPTAEITAEPTAAPTQEASPEPTNDPMNEPTAELTNEPTSEPTFEPSAEPSMEPSSEPTIEPTLEPTSEPTIEPTIEPSPEPSLEPSPAPGTTALPEQIDGLVHISAENGAQQQDGSWSVALTASGGALAFAWTAEVETQRYLVYVQDDPQSMKLLAETAQMRVELPVADYAMGQHTLYVGAVLADESLSWGSAVFSVASQQGGFPGGMGGFPGGRMPGGMQGMPEEQGLRITPGVALTDSHSSGSMNSRDYRAVAIAESAEPLTTLELSVSQSRITLDGGASSFLAELSQLEARLALIPAEGGECWETSLLALETLSASGVDRVDFHLDGGVQSIDTDLELAGAIYGGLRAQGLVDKDFQICISAQGICVRAAGCEYQISGGELTASGE